MNNYSKQISDIVSTVSSYLITHPKVTPIKFEWRYDDVTTENKIYLELTYINRKNNTYYDFYVIDVGEINTNFISNYFIRNYNKEILGVSIAVNE